MNALLRKTWLDYEAELRRSHRLREVFGTATLPSRGTLYRAFRQWPLAVWREIMAVLLRDVIHDGMSIAVDSTGVTLRHASTWFVARIGRHVKKKDHMKLHVIWNLDLSLIIDCRLTRGSRSDSPTFRLMLAPLRKLGVVLGDKAYCCKKTITMIIERGGSPFLAFKKNVSGKGMNLWATQVRFATGPLRWAWMNIYHQRSRIESVFSAVKRRYGSHLRATTLSSRRRELFLRVLAYNVRQLLYIRHAREHNLTLWARA
jgi:transposase